MHPVEVVVDLRMPTPNGRIAAPLVWEKKARLLLTSLEGYCSGNLFKRQALALLVLEKKACSLWPNM